MAKLETAPDKFTVDEAALLRELLEKLLTVDEAALLRELLEKLQVQPTAPNALETVALIQRVYAKIQDLTAS